MSAAAVVVVETPAAPIARPAGYLREFEEADALLEAAKTHRAGVEAAHNEKAGALNAVRQKLGNVLNTRVAQTALLAKAQAELVPAVLAGADHDEVRQRAQDAQTKIEALTSTAAILTKEMERLKVEEQRFHGPRASAQLAVDHAELNLLIAKYAKALVPLIPMAREIRARSPQVLGAAAGYILDTNYPYIGQYKVSDDGTLSFYNAANSW